MYSNTSNHQARLALNNIAQTFSLSAHKIGNLASVQIVIGIVFLSALSQFVVPLPFTPVPLSLGSLGALLVGVTLGWRKALISAGLYATLGAAGVPVFAGFQSGFPLASSGYVIGYIAAAVFIGAMCQTKPLGKFLSATLLAMISSAIIYLFGVIWTIIFFQISLTDALAMGVFPFLVGDFLKSLVVAGAVTVKRRHKSW